MDFSVTTKQQNSVFTATFGGYKTVLLSFTLLGEAVVSLPIYMSQRSCSWELQHAEGCWFLKLGKYSSPCSCTEVLQSKSTFFFVFDAGILQFCVCVCALRTLMNSE